MNNAPCVDAVNGYTCTCAAGFSGAQCQIVNPCSPSPCLNGGTCVVQQSVANDGTNVGPLAVCTCPPGYTGVRCENRITDGSNATAAAVIFAGAVAGGAAAAPAAAVPWYQQGIYIGLILLGAAILGMAAWFTWWCRNQWKQQAASEPQQGKVADVEQPGMEQAKTASPPGLGSAAVVVSVPAAATSAPRDDYAKRIQGVNVMPQARPRSGGRSGADLTDQPGALAGPDLPPLPPSPKSAVEPTKIRLLLDKDPARPAPVSNTPVRVLPGVGPMPVFARPAGT